MKTCSKLLSAFIALVMCLGAIGPASADSVVDDVVKRGKLVVGLATFVPWAMRDKKGDLIGFEVDVSKQLAEGLTAGLC